MINYTNPTGREIRPVRKMSTSERLNRMWAALTPGEQKVISREQLNQKYKALSPLEQKDLDDAMEESLPREKLDQMYNEIAPEDQQMIDLQITRLHAHLGGYGFGILSGRELLLKLGLYMRENNITRL